MLFANLAGEASEDIGRAVRAVMSSPIAAQVADARCQGRKLIGLALRFNPVFAWRKSGYRFSVEKATTLKCQKPRPVAGAFCVRCYSAAAGRGSDSSR